MLRPIQLPAQHKLPGRVNIRDPRLVDMRIDHHHHVRDKRSDHEVRQKIKREGSLARATAFLNVADLSLNFRHVFVGCSGVDFDQVGNLLLHLLELIIHETKLTDVAGARIECNNVSKSISQLGGCSTRDVLHCDEFNPS